MFSLDKFNRVCHNEDIDSNLPAKIIGVKTNPRRHVEVFSTLMGLGEFRQEKISCASLWILVLIQASSRSEVQVALFRYDCGSIFYYRRK